MDVVPVLSVADLTVSLADNDKVAVVRDFNIELFPGSITALVGESGSGKSLACLAIMDLLPQALVRTSGVIKYNGQLLSDKNESELRKYRGNDVAYVFQDPASCLNPVLSVAAQLDEVMVAHFPQLDADGRKGRALTLLQEVGLGEISVPTTRYPHQLSGGQRQRLLLALSLAAEPSVLIADEITTALDPATQQVIVDLLAALCAERQIALVFITHDIVLAKKIAHNVVVMHDSRVVETGTCHEIFENPQHAQTSILIDAASSQHGTVAYSDQSELVLKAEALSIAYRVPKIFGRAKLKRIVHNVSFSLRRGQTLAVVGKSGSGKSTIARAVCGLAHHIEGTLELYLSDETIDLSCTNHKQMRPYRRHVSMIFQDPTSSLNPLTAVVNSVAEPMLVHLDISAVERTERAMQLLTEVGLDAQSLAQRLPRELSGGQCQRVAIARALALNPAVVVCDEAISSLDITAQREIIELLSSLQKQRQLSYLFISHDHELVDSFAHQVLRIDD